MKFYPGKWTNEELRDIIVECNKTINFREELEQLLDSSNLTISDLKFLKRAAKSNAAPKNVSKKKVGAPKGVKVAPKWRHKEDSTLTWSGRGLTPKWVKKYGVKV